MAWTAENAYVTEAEFKSAVKLTGNTDHDDKLSLAATAASRAVDDHCGRRFYVDDATSVRYFTATEPSCLRLTGDPTSVDIASTVDVEVAVDWTGAGTYTDLAASTWRLGPLSAPAEGRPYTRIDLLSAARLFPVGLPDAVKVTATFGWPGATTPATAPAAVREAAMLQAVFLYRRIADAPLGVVGGVGLDGGIVTDTVRVGSSQLVPDARALLARLERGEQRV